MQVTYIGLDRDQIPELASRLEVEPYPTTCNVVLFEERSAGGVVLKKVLRLELSADSPGVTFDLVGHVERIEWAIGELVRTRRSHGIP